MANPGGEDKRLAEYFAAHGAAEEEEDEADFDPSDDGEESDPFEDDDDDDDEEGKGGESWIELDGTLHMNDDGNRVVYSGTWATKEDIDKAGPETDSKKDGEPEGKKDDIGASDGGADKKHDKHKKKTKFKLKSKQIVSPGQQGKGDENNAEGPIFDLSNPTVTVSRGKHADGDRSKQVPPKRTMLFDGFFFTAEEEGHRKIKERDVELTFFVEDSCCASEGDKEGSDGAPGQRYRVLGRGTNEFGLFTIEGTYNTAGAPSEKNGTGSDADRYSLLCKKRYQPSASSSSQKRRRNSGNGSSDDDEEMSDDEGADFNELIALNEEAHMSVEELRRRYYGGNGVDSKDCGDAEDGGREPPAKKARASEVESDDDGCGF